MSAAGRLRARVLEEIRRRGIFAPRAYWAARYAPAQLAARAGAGPVAARVRETLASPAGNEPRLPRTPPRGARPVALFYAINGTGLGHLTRCLAIARHLGPIKPVIVTTSVRADVLDAYDIGYIAVEPAVRQKELSSTQWNERLNRTLREAIADFAPAVVVVDGVAPDPGFSWAIRSVPQLGRVGIRRAYRRDGREHLVAQRDAEMDLLIVPHEEGSEEVPLPPGPAARWVGSICLTDRSEVWTREDARAELDLKGDRPAVLVQLGSGALGKGPETRERLFAALEALDVDVVATSYDRGRSGGSVRTVSRYPLAPLYPAFDLAIAAAGYNTYTELMHIGIPSVLIPNEHMRSDDQTARARRAVRAGAALVARDGDVDGILLAARKIIADEGRRASMAEAGRALVPRNGAPDAASHIVSFCERILA